MENLTYVTYDPATGALTGAYLQALHPDHSDSHIVVDAAIHANWTAYRANAARDGVEPRPHVDPVVDENHTIAAYMAEVQRHMDAHAVTFGYDDLISVVSYAEEPAVPRYQAEGLAFRAWRSLCWARCEEVLAEVKAGEREAPTYAQLIELLPAKPVQEPIA